MLGNYIAAVILLATPIYIAFIMKRKSENRDNHRAKYIKNLLAYIIFLIIVGVVDINVWEKINFSIVGKGYILPVYLYLLLLLFNVMPFFMAILPEKKKSSTSDDSKGEIYGVPVNLYPNSFHDLLWFSIYAIAGVVVEEIIFRQFMFSVFHSVFNLTGDALLLLTGILFTVGHLGQKGYKKLSRVIVIFISGLFYGKCFQMSGSIYYPIVIHLLANGAIIVIAYKRILVKRQRTNVY